MKKIFCSIIMLIIINFGQILHVNGYKEEVSVDDVMKPLVCVMGNDYSYLLEYEGFTIINKLIDFNHEGTYFVTYMKDDTKETYTKRIDVISKGMTTNIYYRYDENKVISSADEVIDIWSSDYNTYVLEKEKVQDEFIYYLTKIKDNKNTFAKEILKSANVTLNKILKDDNNIYILGTIYKDNYGTDIYIIKTDLEGNIVCENTIGGTGIDDAKGMVIYGDYIYLYGCTTSSGGLFQGIRKKEDAFILKLNKDMLHPDSVKINILENINCFSEVTISDELIYVLEQYSDNDYVKYNLKIYNPNLDILYNNSIVNSYALYPEKLVTLDNKVYLIAFQYNYMIEKYASRIYEIKENGEINLIYEYTNYSGDNIRIIDAQVKMNKMNILMYDYNSLCAKLYLKDDNVLININNSSKPCTFIKKDDSNISFLTVDKSVYDLLYIKFDTSIIINGEKANLSNLSKINNEYLSFGNYQNIYVYESTNALFANYENKYVEPDVSIIDGEIFDINTKLTFNGVATLNGRKIESGSFVTEEGEYVLEVIGINGEKKVFNFKVRNLSNKLYEEKEKCKLLNVSLSTNKQVSHDNVTYTSLIDNMQIREYFFFPLLVPLIFLVVFIIVLVRRKHEK